MVARHLANLEAVLSKPRLDVYVNPGGTDFDKIVNYFWNIDLAEALVPSLHAIEVALRNAIHTYMTQKTGDSLWFFQKRLLRPDELQDFLAAYNKVHKKPNPVDGLIVSQCMFGFWSALLSRTYDEEIWKPNGYEALYTVFPGAAKANPNGNNYSRGDIAERMFMINQLRNRVFHYERIYEWTYRKGNEKSEVVRTARQDHHDIHEAIKWLSPMLHEMIQAVDNFDAAWNGRDEVAEDLKKRLGL